MVFLVIIALQPFSTALMAEFFGKLTSTLPPSSTTASFARGSELQRHVALRLLSVGDSEKREQTKNLLPHCYKIKPPLNEQALEKVEARLRKRDIETLAAIGDPAKMLASGAFAVLRQAKCRQLGVDFLALQRLDLTRRSHLPTAPVFESDVRAILQQQADPWRLRLESAPQSRHTCESDSVKVTEKFSSSVINMRGGTLKLGGGDDLPKRLLTLSPRDVPSERLICTQYS